MILRVDVPQYDIKDTLTGNTAHDVVKELRAKIRARANFGQRLGLKLLSDLDLCNEIIKRYEDKEHVTPRSPGVKTYDEFITWGVKSGLAEIIEK